MSNSTHTTNKTDLISNIIRGFLVAIAIVIFFVFTGAATDYVAYNYYSYPCDSACDSASDDFRVGRNCKPCPINFKAFKSPEVPTLY
jgi:hypothetical protein